MRWKLLLFLGLVALGICLELFFRRFLRERYPALMGKGESRFRMEPHIFSHFLPSNRQEDVDEDGFRIARTPGSRLSEDYPKVTIYLAGDCTLFEDHLPLEETFAHQLSDRLNDAEVLNAGAPHYTALHSYHRFVTDVIRGYRPQSVLLFSAANDCLSFVHHKQGRVERDHTHLYKPWGSYEILERRLWRCPSATLKFGLFHLLFDRKKPDWEDLAEEISPTFQELESARMARAIFDPSVFVTCLELFEGTCRAIGAELILTTYAYQKNDMLEEPRKTYAWGIDAFNQKIREFAQHRSLKLIDLAEGLEIETEDITNKWHYTASGNRKRAEMVEKALLDAAIDLSR